MKKSAPVAQSALTVEMWPVDKPVPYVRNARSIPQSAIDKVAASVQEFGWRQPIVVDAKGVIVAGHTRLLAAKKLGLKEVPVHVAENLSPAQVKAYRLMDNRSHDETAWMNDLLGLELEEIRDLDEIDLALTGFRVGDIRDKKGIYRNFVSDTIQAFEDAGALLYNEAILVTAVGSLPIRVGKQFEASRKLGKTHQNVLCFVKGDPKKATADLGDVEYGMTLADDEVADDDVLKNVQV